MPSSCDNDDKGMKLTNIDINQTPSSYKSVQDLPEVLRQIEEQSTCYGAHADGYITAGEALCVLDFFSGDQFSLNDLQAARQQSGVARLVTMEDRQLVDLADYLAAQLLGFPSLGAFLDQSSNALVLGGSSAYRRAESPSATSIQPSQTAWPATTSPTHQEQENSPEKNPDLRDLMTKTQRDRFEDICDRIRELDYGDHLGIQTYHQKLGDLLHEVELPEDIPFTINCEN